MITRLKKIADSLDYGVGYNTLYFEDDFNWIENNNIIKEQHGPTINKNWKFEEPIDYPEQQLICDNECISRLKFKNYNF